MKQYLSMAIAIIVFNGIPGETLAEDKSEANTVAQRENVHLTAEDIRAAKREMNPQRVEVLLEEATSRESLAKDLLLRRVLAEQARKTGLETRSEYAARLRIAYERLLSDLYLEYLETADIDMKKLENRAREEYRVYPERYRKDEIRVRHILAAAHPSCQKDPFETITALKARIKAGESFEALAQQYSDDKGSGAKGGDLGWVVRGRMVKQFEEAVFALKEPGELSDPIRTEFGVHLIQLVERKDAVVIPFDEVKSKIVDGMILKHRQAKRDATMQTLNDPAQIRFDAAALENAVR